MAEWTRDAKEYLEGYLLQTAALARSRNDDVDEIDDELRNHILIETEKEAGSVVSLDQLRKVLATLGTPEQVYGQEGKSVMGGTPSEDTPTLPITPGTTSQLAQTIPKKPKTVCFKMLIFALLTLIIVGVAVVVGLFLHLNFQDTSGTVTLIDEEAHIIPNTPQYIP